MKNIFILGCFIFIPLFIIAQENDSIEIQKQDSIHTDICKSQDTTKLDFVPFAIIEHAPIFPRCEKLDEHLRRMCLQNQIKWHVEKKFNTGMADKLGLSEGKKKTYVIFKIDNMGYVTDIRARGPHRALEQEAIRVIKLLPQMIPGKNGGKTVGVKYTLPITILVEKPRKKRGRRNH